MPPENAKPNVIDLFGADAKAIIAACERACANADLSAQESARAAKCAEGAEAMAKHAKEAADSATRGAWAAHDRARKVEERLAKIEQSLAELKENHSGLAERTAAEIIRLTVETRKLKERGVSNPEIERRLLGIVDLHIEEETTEVREKRSKSEDRAKVRALVITWAQRAAIVIGPLLTALVMRYCGQ